MTDTEYEYSFKVTDITPYLKYCDKNNYEKISETAQIRTLYTSSNKILARITTEEKNNTTRTFIDFKTENDSDVVLKIAKESIPFEVNESNKEAINSMLDILGYSKHKELIRKRYVYKKGNVKFEIDNYTAPEMMCVIAREGEKENVDKVYNEISNM